MDEEERARVAALPEVVTAYRGFSHFSHPGGQAGIAWTLERERAESRSLYVPTCANACSRS